MQTVSTSEKYKSRGPMLLQVRSKRKPNVQEFHLQLQPEKPQIPVRSAMASAQAPSPGFTAGSHYLARCHAKKQPHTFLSQIGLNGHVCFTCQSLWKLVTLHLDLCRVPDCALCQKFFSLLLGILSVFTQCSTQTFASLHCVLN